MRSSRWRPAAYAVIGLGIAVVIAAILLSALAIGQVRETQVDRQPQVRENDKTFALLVDCVEPGGTCYARSQRQTAKAVGDIGAANILAVVCALDIPDATPFDQAVKQVSRCVADGLRRPNR